MKRLCSRRLSSFSQRLSSSRSSWRILSCSPSRKRSDFNKMTRLDPYFVERAETASAICTMHFPYNNHKYLWLIWTKDKFSDHLTTFSRLVEFGLSFFDPSKIIFESLDVALSEIVLGTVEILVFQTRVGLILLFTKVFKSFKVRLEKIYPYH